VKAILEASSPRSTKGLRTIFGVCGWLREYVPDFTDTAVPLTALLAQGRVWKWTSAEQSAFEATKRMFEWPLVLFRPEPKRRYYLQTDAAKTRMEAVLYQLDDEGTRRVISYASAKFPPAEAKYDSNEQECLAVI
jgi:hypothetical protein